MLAPVLYAFRDNNPLVGSNYYRLKQIDLDDHFTYSKIVKIDFASGKSQINILANPVTDNLIVNVDLASAEMLTLRITDVNGKLITSQGYQGSKGNNQINLFINRLSAGNYILNVTSRTISSGKKFVKL